MILFFCSLEHKEKEKEIFRILEELLPSDQIEVHCSVRSLFQKLKKPMKDKPIVVVLIHQRKELLEITSIREQFFQVYLVLILPDAQKETISLSHNLRPNYLTYMHSDLNELKAVLEKILKRS